MMNASTPVSPRAHKLHGEYRHYAAGDVAELNPAVPAVAAVVQGRLRLQLDPEETMILRASDAASIPAGAHCRLEALEESLVYHYTETSDDLWGV